MKQAVVSLSSFLESKFKLNSIALCEKVREQDASFWTKTQDELKIENIEKVFNLIEKKAYQQTSSKQSLQIRTFAFQKLQEKNQLSNISSMTREEIFTLSEEISKEYKQLPFCVVKSQIFSVVTGLATALKKGNLLDALHHELSSIKQTRYPGQDLTVHFDTVRDVIKQNSKPKEVK